MNRASASNGDLYFIMEPAETDNLFLMVTSSDGGRTWAGGGRRESAADRRCGAGMNRFAEDVLGKGSER